QGVDRLSGHRHGALRAADARRDPPPAGRRSDDRRGRAKRVHSRGLLVWTYRHDRGAKRTMTLLLSAWTVGLILALLALGVYISFRLFSFPDITVDGSFALGAVLAAVLMTRGPHQLFSSLSAIYLWPAAWIPAPGGIHPIAASLLAMLGGALAGTCTGVLHTRFRINGLLAGILVMTALYSVNLFVLGKSNQPLLDVPTLASYGDALADAAAGERTRLQFLIWEFAPRESALFVLSLLLVGLAIVLLYLFLRTELGT